MTYKGRGLYRLAFIILAIPVGLLLVLHFFGENKMNVEMRTPMTDCLLDDKTRVYLTGDHGAMIKQEKNQIARLERLLERKELPLNKESKPCFADTTALLLVDSKENLRGSYALDQAGINRLMMELDILLMRENYGKEVSR